MGECVLCWEHLQKTFTDGIAVQALQDVSGTLRAGEIVGVVGESGCGKSTLARALARLTDVDGGKIWLMGREISCLRGRALRRCYASIQMVFQDAVSSFDPRLPVGLGIDEALENFTSLPPGQRLQERDRLLETVGLQAHHGTHLPGELSGGECQRAAIARALAARPGVLICDEATSALDVSMQAQVVELLYRLAGERQMGVLFISHDLALVNSLCTRVVVMYGGQVVEEGDTRAVLGHPQAVYTRQLLSDWM